MCVSYLLILSSDLADTTPTGHSAKRSSMTWTLLVFTHRKWESSLRFIKKDADRC